MLSEHQQVEESLFWEIAALEKYTCTEVLGSGEFGEVKICEFDGNDYAIKTLNVGDSYYNLVSAVTEISFYQSISHPHMMKPFEYAISDNGKKYSIVMKPGGKALSQKGPYTIETFKLLLWQILSVIDYFQANNVQHNDLHTNNILMENGYILAIDPGIATYQPYQESPSNRDDLLRLTDVFKLLRKVAEDEDLDEYRDVEAETIQKHYDQEMVDVFERIEYASHPAAQIMQLPFFSGFTYQPPDRIFLKPLGQPASITISKDVVEAIKDLRVPENVRDYAKRLLSDAQDVLNSMSLADRSQVVLVMTRIVWELLEGGPPTAIDKFSLKPDDRPFNYENFAKVFESLGMNLMRSV